MAYHVHGVAEVSPGVFTEVTDEEAQCFGLYDVVQMEQGEELEWISDHPTREEARQAMLALQNR